jgi:hypothetical protein
MAKAPVKDMTILRRLLRATVGVLDKHHIPYILDYGGALGLARTGAAIPWDCDLDLSLPMGPGDWERRIRDAMRLLRRRGVVVKSEWTRGRIVVIDGGVGIDLFFWIRNRQGAWERVQTLGVEAKFGKGVGMQDAWFDETEIVRFETADVRVPVDLEGLVAHRYGADWRKPRRYFAEQKAVFDAATTDNAPTATDNAPNDLIHPPPAMEAAEAPSPPVQHGPTVIVPRDGTPTQTVALPEETPVDPSADTPIDPSAEWSEEENDDAPDLGSMNMRELKALAKELPLPGYSTLAKDELLAALRERLS